MAVEQTGARQQHGAAHTEPIRRIRPAMVFNRRMTSALTHHSQSLPPAKQGVDVPAQLAKSFVCRDSQTAIRDK
jgi:hypothetical protein